jgi:Uma2 family endonuclease
MSTLSSTPGTGTFAELLDRLGVTPDRILMDPPPGKATVKDLLRVMERTERLFELVEGTLVEKVMGYLEGSVAMWLGHLLQQYLDSNDIGNLAGSDSTMRIMPGLVRLPDLSFVRWEKLPGRVLPTKPAPDLAPDLAIEVLSKKNTPKELKRKRREYFLSGAEVVWLVDPRRRTVSVFTTSDPEAGVTLTEADTLDGGTVLPGLALPVARIFERLPKEARRPPRKKRG